MKEKIIIYCDRIIEICLYFLIFCLPFTKAGVEIFLWNAILLWMIKRLLGYRTKGLWGIFPATELNKALGIFIIINALSVIVSANLGLSIRGFFGKVSKFMILYFMVVEMISNKKRLKNTLIFMVMSVVFIVADAGAQYFSGRDFLRGYPFGGRLSASFSSQNGFGAWLIMLIPIFLGILATKQLNSLVNRIKKIILGALIILMLVCLLLTGSRGAWLGFLFGLVLFGYWVIKLLYYHNKILTFLLMMVFLIGIFLILPSSIKERIGSITQIEYIDRIDFWKESFNIFKDFPVIGCGLNTYSVVAPHYKITKGGGIYPHNSFLHMAAETGILGLVSFLWIIIVLFRSGFKTLNRNKNPLLLGMLAGILAFLVHSLFDVHLYSLKLVVLLWFIMGLTVAVMRLSDNFQVGKQR